MAEVGDLWYSLGLRVKRGEWAQGDAALEGTRRKLSGLTGALARFNGAFQDVRGRWRATNGQFLTMRDLAALAKGGVDDVGDALDKAGKKGKKAGESFGFVAKALSIGAAFIGGKLVAGGVKFNATAEEARNQIAGMISLSKNTKFTDELGAADTLMANLQRRAASLPGTTAEYIAMLGNIAQPVTKAGLGMQELEDLTVGAVVAAKALREDAGAAARDVGQALRGQVGADDPFIGKLLDTKGFEGQEGRARFNQKSAKERARIVKELLTSAQLKDMAEAQGQSFSGILSTLQDSMQQFFGRVGKPLFEGLVEAIKSVNVWLEANQETVRAVAETIGGALVAAFEAVRGAIEWLIEHGDVAIAVLSGIAAAFVIVRAKAAAAWLASLAGPLALVAALSGIIYIVRKIIQHPDQVRAAFSRAWDAIKAGAGAVWEALKSAGDRVLRFFTDDIPNAIVAAFRAAFEFIRNLPVVKQIIDAIQWVRGQLSGGDQQAAAQAAAIVRQQTLFPGSSVIPLGPSGQRALQVDVGGITVNSSAADPKRVAVEVHKVFDERMGNMLRQARDRTS